MIISDKRIVNITAVPLVLTEQDGRTSIADGDLQKEAKVKFDEFYQKYYLFRLSGENGQEGFLLKNFPYQIISYNLISVISAADPQVTKALETLNIKKTADGRSLTVALQDDYNAAFDLMISIFYH